MTPSTSSAPHLASERPAGSTRPGSVAGAGSASFSERFMLRRRGPLLRRLREEIHPGSGVRVLDLGGGTGVTTERFAGGAGEVVVLEPDPRKVVRGRAARTAIGFVEGVAERIPFEEGRFDRVVSLMSFHHFQDSARALSEGHRVLVPGGSLTVCDVDPGSLAARLFQVLHALTFHGALSFTNGDEVARRMRAAGFSNVRREDLGRVYLVTATK